VANATKRLRAFLDDPARPADTLRYHELQGFLFTVACAPELIRPSEWMPIVFGDREREYANLDEAKQVMTDLMALYNTINGAVFRQQPALPAGCAFRDEILANLDDDAPIRQWSHGFRLGHTWLEDVWDQYVPEELDDQFAATLLTLSFFSSRKIAEAFRQESAPSKTLEEFATAMRRLFPDALAEYAHFGRSISQVIAEAGRTESTVTRPVKVGRNDPCPCGSGRKYKKCCGGVH
jgi:uncharacterized protein